MCDLFRPQTDTFTYTTNFGCKKQTPFQIFRPVAPLSAHARYAYVLAMIKQPFLFFLIYIFVDILAGVVGTALLLKAIMSICLLVRRSVCHTGEPRQASVVQNIEIPVCFIPCERVMSAFLTPNFVSMSLGVHPE